MEGRAGSWRIGDFSPRFPMFTRMAKPKKTTRRDFLTGTSAVEALADLAHGQPLPAPTGCTPGAAPAAEGHTPVPAPTYLLEVGRTAMACEFQVFLNAGQHPYGADAALKALDLVDALEDQLTVYRSHSEVSRLNRLANDEPVNVEPRLFELLQQAKQLHQETECAFDITTGVLTKTWGFYRRAGRFPGDAEIAHALAHVGSQWLSLDADEQTVFFTRPLEINLGAIGKGHTLDRCADLLTAEGISHFMIHGGMSSILARGTRSDLNENQTGWTVALRHPFRLEQRLAEIQLRDRALGTSGSGTQFFYHEGKRYGHILDPRTGRPADGVLSTTVLAPTAAVADALATAFFVLGLEKTQAYCAAHPEISAILVTPTNRQGGMQIHAINLADDDWTSY